MNAATILHVTSLFGGGVERHLRDIVRTVERAHLIWHAGNDVDVIEDPHAGRFWPLARGAVDAQGEQFANWLRARRVGLVHLHQLTQAPRDRARWVRETLGVAQLATLHDILFLREDAFAAANPLEADPPWLAQTAAALHESRAVLAPSRWLAALAARHVPGLAVDIVPNGSSNTSIASTGIEAIATRHEYDTHRTRHVIALLGALGPHKGSGVVDAIAERLAGTDIGVVVVGYLEQQFHPGWRIPGRLFVHGAFAEGEAPGLLRGYGAQLVLMPNVVPESFSYALSDAWAAGVPVLAAPAGALAERIAEHGGGWLLPEGFDAIGAANVIRALIGGARDADRAKVQSRLARPDPARIPPLQTMTRTLDAYYARFGIDPAAPASANDTAIESLLATNLDGSLFRRELVRLSDELAQTLAALEESRRRGEAFETEARGWIAKLEGDVRTVQDELRRTADENARLVKDADLLRLNQEALDRLPAPLKRLLLKLAFNARR